MGLAERVTTSRQGGSFDVVHTHPLKSDADVARGLQGIGDAARTFGIDVDQAHLDRGQRLFQRHLLVGLDAGFIALGPDPLFLGTPVDVLFRLPDVGATAAEAKHRAAHRLDADVAREDEQVGP